MFDGLCFQDGETVLFVGDSITDCGRRAADRPYGNGYVSLIVEMVIAALPERDIRFINKGIGGNTVVDLQNRWEDDVLRFEPDWLCVKIGINDIHRWLRGTPEAVPPALFRKTYDEILARAAERCSPKMVLLDPFFISLDTSGKSFRSDVLAGLSDYIAVVADMSEKYGAKRVKLHDMFQRLLASHPADTFCPEPVHPYRSGHVAMTLEIFRVLCEGT